MHDDSLGPMVDVGLDPDANHKGPCNDGVYGCSRCWNEENDGTGTVHTCEWCKAPNAFTRIVKAWDEPVYYAICALCEKKQADELYAMSLEDDDYYPGYDDNDYPDEDE